ncbi:MAG: hypothetical protein A2W76_07640 [Gammaproteobacteria bacterium RIFCSPLOWO2_12_47_11]|nr:MAG: hypothetical protein A2W76_07640 [Gammaproteobacteria bacterium RIFCSPLOWO2_12_47_11]
MAVSEDDKFRAKADVHILFASYNLLQLKDWEFKKDVVPIRYKCLGVVMTFKKIFFLIISMALFIPLSIYAHVETTITQVVLPKHLIQLVVIPMWIWFIKLVFEDAKDRYHLIRNLYSEIIRNHSMFAEVKKLFPSWKEENIDGKKVPAFMERLTWNKFLSTRVYDSSQTNIIRLLWAKEIPNIHGLYSNFIELDRLLISVAAEINEAKREYIYSTPAQSDKVDKLLESTIKQNIKVVNGKAHDISDLLDIVCKDQDGRKCARDQFYSLKIYLFHVLIFAILCILLWISF